MPLARCFLATGAMLAAALPLGRAVAMPLPPSMPSLSAIVSPGVPPPMSLTPIAPVAATQQVEFEVLLPLRNAAGLDALIAAQQDPTSPSFHQWLTPASFAAQFGPSPATIAYATLALRALGLQVTPNARSLHVSGSASAVNAALNVNLQNAADVSGKLRIISPTVPRWPGALSTLGAVVPSFAPRPFTAAPSARRYASGYARRFASGYGMPASAVPPSGGLLFDDLRQAYDFPSLAPSGFGTAIAPRLDGTGTTVAVLMAGDVLDSDISALFGPRTAPGAAPPRVSARIPVDGGTNPSTDNPLAEEATLDAEQVLGAAPGTQLELYETPDLSDRSLLAALARIDQDDTADVVSLSFGQCEQYYTAAYNGGQDQTAVLRSFSELFKQGNAEGITFVAASGDAGGLGCIQPSYFAGGNGAFVTGVSVPAADPNVTAVGGTNLVVASDNGGSDSSYVSENAWSDPEAPFDPYGLGGTASGGVWGAGGGVSTLFPRPYYQAMAATGSSAFRALPDLAAQMGGCPVIATAPCGTDTNPGRSVLSIVFNGTWDGMVGSSAAAPQMAGIFALLVQNNGRQGNINPMLYAMAQNQASGGPAVFRQSIPGNNGVSNQGGAYSYSTGNGTLDVAQFLGLPTVARAGAPGTSGNP